jgi:hypothetical protein
MRGKTKHPTAQFGKMEEKKPESKNSNLAKLGTPVF